MLQSVHKLETTPQTPTSPPPLAPPSLPCCSPCPPIPLPHPQCECDCLLDWYEDVVSRNKILVISVLDLIYWSQVMNIYRCLCLCLFTQYMPANRKISIYNNVYILILYKYRICDTCTISVYLCFPKCLYL